MLWWRTPVSPPVTWREMWHFCSKYGHFRSVVSKKDWIKDGASWYAQQYISSAYTTWGYSLHLILYELLLQVLWKNVSDFIRKITKLFYQRFPDLFRFLCALHFHPTRPPVCNQHRSVPTHSQSISRNSLSSVRSHNHPIHAWPLPHWSVRVAFRRN